MIQLFVGASLPFVASSPVSFDASVDEQLKMLFRVVHPGFYESKKGDFGCMNHLELSSFSPSCGDDISLDKEAKKCMKLMSPKERKQIEELKKTGDMGRGCSLKNGQMVSIGHNPLVKSNFKKAVEYGMHLFKKEGDFWSFSKGQMIAEVKYIHKLLFEGLGLSEGVLAGEFRQDVGFVMDEDGRGVSPISKVSYEDQKKCKAILSDENRLDRLVPKDFRQLSKVAKIYTPWRKIDHFIRKFLTKIQEMHASGADPIDLAAFAHHNIVHIHPFGDGNGRVARILMNSILMNSGYGPITFPMRKEYVEKSSDINFQNFAQYLRTKISN